ncbi:MAG: NACHT domain-containing protein [Planctomycetes bacterium]|nr:NACHT domain-containing protein [Planctomycetota bacterium]
MPITLIPSIASIAGLAANLIQWKTSQAAADPNATVQDYIEFLRRENHKELLDRLESSEQLQTDLQKQIKLLSRTSGLASIAVTEKLARLDRDLTDYLDRLPEQLGDVVLQNLFDFDAHRVDSRDLEFEKAYLQQIDKTYGRLKTMGVRELRDVRQELTVAYISLNLKREGADSLAPDLIDAETVVAAEPLLTIRGPAGSGKTTLLQWIAVQCGQHDDANPWIGGIPFFVPLRSLEESQEGRPSVKRLVETSIDISQLALSPPEGWLQRVINDGRAVLLIDGVDELPPDHRPNFWEWVGDWIEDHSSARCYVTSRFFADKGEDNIRQWNPNPGFRGAELDDMTDGDIAAFVRKWHDAVMQTETDRDERRNLERAAKALPEKLRDPANARVRDLCRTPLLCGLICALHWREEGYLPSRRVDLYERCCNMLIEERDRKREIPQPEGPLRAMSLADKKMVLERLAWSMMRNVRQSKEEQRTEITRQQAIRWIKPHISSFQNADARVCTADAVLGHLIDRSGLLREPARGKLDFPHRTFQEYLAACAAGYHDDAGELAQHAKSDQWHETIILAAGTDVGGSSFGNRLIEALLREAEQFQAPEARNKRRALALACLETGKQIKPDIARKVLDQLDQLVPPDSKQSARALAAAGNALLPHLEYHRIKAAGYRALALSAHAIARVGTHAAAELLSDPNGYGGDTRATVIVEACACAPLNPLSIPQVQKWLLQETYPQSVEVAIRRASDLSPLASLTGLTSLSLRGFNNIISLDGLESLANLRTLNLTGCKCISRPDGLADLVHLAALSSLQKLVLANTQVTDAGLEHVAALGSLQWLSLDNTKVTDAGLEHLAGLTRLQTLWLDNTKVTDAGLERLAGLTGLQELSLNGTQVSDAGLAHLAGLGSLQSLWLVGTKVTDAGLAHLAALGSFQMLSLARTQVSDAGLAHLAGLGSLQMLSLAGTKVSDAGLAHLAALGSLQKLSLEGTQVTDTGLAHLAALGSFQMLSLARTQVSDAGLAHLAGLGSLQRLWLYGTQVSDAGVAKLKEALPNCYITR